MTREHDTFQINIPSSCVRKAMQHFFEGPISQKALSKTQFLLEMFLIEISHQSQLEFTVYNEARMVQGLPYKKRLNLLAIERAIPVVLDKFYKNYRFDILGFRPEVIESPGGKEMRDTGETTKSATNQSESNEDTV